MSYLKAKQCFDKNAELIKDPNSGPLMWNLSVGLANLTKAVEMDIDKLTKQLRQIAGAVRNLERR